MAKSKQLLYRLILFALILALVAQISGCAKNPDDNKTTSDNTNIEPSQEDDLPEQDSSNDQKDKIKNDIEDYLLLTYSEENIINIDISEKKSEVKIQTSISDKAPDDWEKIKETACADCEKIKELTSEYNNNAILCLINNNSGYALTVTNGNISYDAFEESKGGDNLPTISLYEFNLITIGMSYSEVCRIVGSSGTVDYEYDSGLFHIISYDWDGEEKYSSASITFTDGEVSSKIQYGLK